VGDYESYRKHVDRLLDDMELRSKAADLVEQVSRLAALYKISVDQMDGAYDGLVRDFNRCGIQWTKTKAEFISDALRLAESRKNR
jgi:hypothetical protein